MITFTKENIDDSLYLYYNLVNSKEQISELFTKNPISLTYSYKPYKEGLFYQDYVMNDIVLNYLVNEEQ